MKVFKLDKFKSKKQWSDYVWQRLLKDIKNPVLSVALDSLLGRYEKNIIINRFAAIALIKEGRTYREIGRELWLSANTIRSLKRILESNSMKEYQSYRLRSNRQKQAQIAKELDEIKREINNSSDFLNWVDYCISVMPKKNGPRWRFVR